MKTSFTIQFVVTHLPDLNAGLPRLTQDVTLSFSSDEDLGVARGDVLDHFRGLLEELLEADHVRTYEETEELEEEERRNR